MSSLGASYHISFRSYSYRSEGRVTRVRIDPDVAAAILVAAHRTCCVCQIPGKPLQIHHIDGDHSNDDPSNLVPLCLLCHDETQLRGGFGRHLDAAQVRRYRDDWFERVRHRKNEADRLSIDVMAAITSARSAPPAMNPRMPVVDYVQTLPELRRRAYERARPDWDSGATANMVNATTGVIDVMEEVLGALATYYPEGHFDRQNPREYFSELISTRYRWHSYHHEPDGRGNNGTIVQVMVAGSTLEDVEEMVMALVSSLTMNWEDDEAFTAWKARWEAAELLTDTGGN